MMKNNTTSSAAKMVATKSATCSTPEHGRESPSRDSDSLCDSEAASPVPFLCTQDGADGETDVVWNFYTPKHENTKTRLKNSTPLSRKSRRPVKMKAIQSPLQKRRTVRPTQKRTEIFQDLIELNRNLHELIAKKTKTTPSEKRHSGSEDDIFNDSGDSGSPKSGLRTNSRCLRRNVLSSKFSKPDPDIALESDDSINECLIKASQMVEEKILEQDPVPAKRSRYEDRKINSKISIQNDLNLDNDSMDAILNNMNMDTSSVCQKKNYGTPRLNNDSFDSLVGNLNDSALERLTQMRVNESTSRKRMNVSSADWTVQEVVIHDSPSAKHLFNRHNSMPESPVTDLAKPSTSGMVFGRYNSVPIKDVDKNIGDSPIRCTPEEIRKKHQQAREKLLAKRQLPFTSSQASQPTQHAPAIQQMESKKILFKPKVAGTKSSTTPNPVPNKVIPTKPIATNPMPSKITTKLNTCTQSQLNAASTQTNSAMDLKLLIEKKRQEALMKLRRRQQNPT